MASDIIFNWVAAEDLDDALALEQQSYPADEAASLELFKLRQAQAGDLFLGVYLPSGSPRRLIGYVCSTQSPAESLTHESMLTHIPSSSSVCVHSICVSPDHRNKGVGSRLLREYVSRLKAAREDNGAPYERILLITHDNLRSFYESAGFEWIGKSPVVHGSLPWYEMRIILDPAPIVDPLPSPDQTIPPGLLEALQRPSRSKPSPKLLTSFPGGVADVATEVGESHFNKFDLLCPRNDCKSIILKKGVAKLVERSSVELEPPNYPANALLPSLPAPPSQTHWWLITPSPMQFENIGFTRPVRPLSGGANIKLLACAECDLGPLGWSQEGGTEFWLACSRVGYRD